MRAARPQCLAALVMVPGCVRHPIGARTIPVARFDYNEAINRSWDEQLLLNLVRLRYRDNPLFVDVNSVTASYSVGRSGFAGTTVGEQPRRLGEVTAGIGLSVGENPVISYGYLRGEEFSQRLLSPLSAADLRALAQSGWSVERLLLCCYQSLNEVENAITAAGPTPDLAPDYAAFQRVAELVRRLQVARQLTWQYEADGRTFVRVGPGAGVEADELRALLGLDRGAARFELVPRVGERLPPQIATQGRSLLGVMYFLSHAVDVPAVHRAAGKVTITRDSSGAEFDWGRVVGRLLHIRSGKAPPADAAVRVTLRDHWYWIEDNDLNSKTTCGLLRLLLFLKSSGAQGPSPLVTIPTR